MNINKNKIISLIFVAASLVLPFGNCIAAQQNSIKEFDIKQISKEWHKKHISSVISKLGRKSINKNSKKSSEVIKKIICCIIFIYSVPIIFTIHQKRLDFLPEFVKDSLRLYIFNDGRPYNNNINNFLDFYYNFSDHCDCFNIIHVDVNKIELDMTCKKNFIIKIPLFGRFLHFGTSCMTMLFDGIEEYLKFKLSK